MDEFYKSGGAGRAVACRRVPCGTSDGGPIGVMLVGRHFEDATVLRAGHAYQQAASG
jgi:Asp-tRNA(Asn)/Glu-tRNA(Gln) amidotransferase A subunit family amidase